MRDSTFCSNPVSNNLEQGLPNGIVTLLGNIWQPVQPIPHPAQAAPAQPVPAQPTPAQPAPVQPAQVQPAPAADEIMDGSSEESALEVLDSEDELIQEMTLSPRREQRLRRQLQVWKDKLSSSSD